MKKLLLIALPALVLFSSCREIFAKRIRGNGNITTQTRTANAFDGIDVSGAIHVIVRQDASTAIKVETDDNLQQYIEVFEQGNLLRIKVRDGYNVRSSHGVKVYVSSNNLKTFMASGACSIDGENQIVSNGAVKIDLSGSCDVQLDLQASRIDAEGSGACTMKLKGRTGDFVMDASGSTDIKCLDLIAKNVNIEISGAGDAEVYAEENLKGSLSGAATIHYRGNARTDVETSGASSVKKID